MFALAVPVLRGAGSDVAMVHRHSRALSVALAGPGSPGFGVEVAGCGSAFAGGGLDAVVPGDAEPVSRSASRAELPVLDPVVDDAGAAAQPAGGVGDADLAVVAGRRGGDAVGVADPLHGLDVERAAVPGDHPGGVQLPGQLGSGRDGSELADHLDRRRRAAPGRAGVDGAGDAELVGGAGVPADPDPDFAAVGFGQQGDIGDQGAQQPLAVLAAGRRGVPQAGQVGGEFLQLGPARQRRQRLGRGLQCLPGLGEGGEPGLPAALQSTSYSSEIAVVRAWRSTK